MKKNNSLKIIIIVGILFLLVPTAYSLISNNTNLIKNKALAEWNVSLVQDDVNKSLVVLPGKVNATYELNVKSLSKVDVKYTVVISGLPRGVKVKFDDGDFQEQDKNNTIYFKDIGTILQTDNEKIKKHYLTFSADTDAEFVNNKEVNINVEITEIM